MKILFVSDYYPPYINGGAEVSTSLLAQWLHERDYEVEVACSRFADRPWQEGGITVHPLIHNPGFNGRGLFSAMYNSIALIVLQWISAWHIVRLIRTFKPDVVNIVPSSYRFIPIILMARICGGRPVIVDCRDYSFVCPAHLSPAYRGGRKSFDETIQMSHGYRCIGYTSKNDPTILGIRPFALYEAIVFNIYKSLARLMINRMDGIRLIAVSDFVLRQLVRNGFAEHKASVIHNIAQHVELAKTTRPSIPTFAFAGRIEVDKGIWDLIAAVEILVRETSKPFAVTIAGGGPGLATLEAYVRDHGLSEHVTLLGHIAPRKVLDVYAASSVVVAPSRWPEPFGRYVLEAITAGRPIIATRSGGAPEGIKEGETGVIVEIGDIPALARAMRDFVENPEHASAMAPAVRERRHFYAPDRIGADRLYAYKGICAQWSAQGVQQEMESVA